MTNDEIRKKPESRNSNQTNLRVRHTSVFGLRISFGFRHSDFGFFRHGTAIVSSSCFTSTSLVTSSASASKVVMMRWRNTSGAMLFTSCGVT